MSRLEQLTAQARMRPDDWVVWCQLARTLVEVGHIGAAMEAVDRAQALARDVFGWLEVGRVRDLLGDSGGAVAAYRRATRLPPSQRGASNRARAEAYTCLGRALLAQGDIDAAILSLRVSVRTFPASPEAECLLAEALADAGRLEEALQHATAAVDVDVENPAGYRVLARAYARLGRTNDGIEALRQLTVIAPNDVPGVVELSTLLSRSGNQGEALSLLQKMSETMERTPSTLLRLGSALAEAGETAIAVKVLRESLRMDPSSAVTHLALGEVFERAGAGPDAAVEFQAAATLEPSSAPAHHRLGLYFMRARRWEEAVRVLVKAASLDPDNDELQMSLAEALNARPSAHGSSSSAAAERSGPPAPTPQLSVVPGPPVRRPVSGARIPMPRLPGVEGSFTGDLSVFALTEVLEFLLSQRATGVLRVTSPEAGLGVIELHQGHIASARTTHTPPLRERLGAAGVPLSGLEDGSSIIDDDARLARWVLSMGVAESKLVVDALERCVRVALHVMIGWSYGQVRFHTLGPEEVGEISLDLCIDPRWALLDLARREDEGRGVDM